MEHAHANALILCVDGYENILLGWEMLLKSEGYEVLTASASDKAMQLFTSHSVDEVVLDYGVRGATGDSIARQMKAIKPGVPILLLSGDDPPSTASLEAVEAFLFKADPITTFVKIVKALLNKYRHNGNALGLGYRQASMQRKLADDAGLEVMAKAA